MTAEITQFDNGKKKFPVISLKYKDKNAVERRLSFGLVKARVILENIDDIRVFVETNGGQ